MNCTPRLSTLSHWLAGALCALAALGTQAQDGCGSLANSYGPFDYRTQRDKLGIVESYHFNAGVEALVRGQSSSNVAGDLSYVMRTSPNHHRALMAVTRLADKVKNTHPPGLQYSVDCYYLRAIRFQPDDTVVRALYAQYLHKTRRTAQARAQLDAAVPHAQDKPLSNYNLGLVYFDIGAYERALAQAHRARALGHEATDLADRLKAAGKWADPQQ
jgi:Tfp pilus assembly protein PilF